MTNSEGRYARRVDLEALHDKVDMLAEGQARLEGKLDGIRLQRNEGLTILGLLSAIGLGIWNLIK